MYSYLSDTVILINSSEHSNNSNLSFYNRYSIPPRYCSDDVTVVGLDR